MKSSASESKRFQSHSKDEILGRARRKERLSRSKLKQAFLTDSDTELFMYLIQCIRFGSWKVRRLNRAWESRRRHNAHFSPRHVSVYLLRLQMGCLQFKKVYGQSGWRVNGTQLLRSLYWKISGSNTEKVLRAVIFFQTACFKGNWIRVLFLYQSHLWYQFQVFEAVFW